MTQLYSFLGLSADKDGKISFNEFLNFLFESKRRHYSEAHEEDVVPVARSLIQKFREADVSEDGYISKELLKQIFFLLEPSLQSGYIIEQFMSVNVREDGNISYEEFLKYLFNNCCDEEEEEE